MMNHLHTITAFAPATSANVAIGFDILGFALSGLGDEVRLTKIPENKIHIHSISGSQTIPKDIQRNTATVSILAMLNSLQLNQGFKVDIIKKIPLSSGLGGSAASSVAALIALNRFLLKPLSLDELAEFALLGEKEACGTKHPDNIIPCLYGGMTLIHQVDPLSIIELPVLPISIVLIHPHLQLETRTARSCLPKDIPLELCTHQNARIAAFISALYTNNLSVLAQACVDELIEPYRADLIPYFYEMKETAYKHGALACSISGSGPSVFAFAPSTGVAKKIGDAMSRVLHSHHVTHDLILTSIDTRGARVVDEH